MPALLLPATALCLALLLLAAATVAQAAPLRTPSRAAMSAAGAWWAFQQRAYPLDDIPASAQMRALRQTHAAHAARSSNAGGAAAGDSDRWISIGPAPIRDSFNNGMPVSGRVTAIAVDPSDSRHWLIGTAQGGVWDSRDAGTSWVPKTDDQASLAFGAVTFAPSNPSIIYAGTGEANFRDVSYAGQGLLKSTDAGTTWTLLASSTFARTAFSDIKVDPTDPRSLVVATARGNFGRVAGWRLPPSPLAAPLAVPPRGVFTSVDGGLSWSQRLNGEATTLEVDPRSFANQYAGIGEIYGSVLNGVYRSSDAGEAWTRIDGPWQTMAGGIGRVESALAASNPNVLYVSIQDALDGVGPDDGGLLGLFRTDNAWDPVPAWVQISTAATDDGTGMHGYCGWDITTASDDDRCWYNHEISVDPTNPDVLYVGALPLWKFDGTTWTDISNSLSRFPNIHADQHALAWAGNRLIVGNDGGVWSTTDAGSTWVDHNATLAITQFYKGALHPTDPNFALAGSQDNGFERWTGVDAWRTVFAFDGMDVALSSQHPKTHWALAVQFLQIFRLPDLAQGDVGIDKTNAPFIVRLEKCPTDDDVLIAGTDNLWKTADFFSAPEPSWSANGPEMGECVVGGSTAGCITALAFAASGTTCSTYAFGTGDGRLLLTTNGGSSWVDLDAGDAVPNRFVTDLAFDPSDSNTLYVTLSGFDEGTPGHPGHVFKTTNALAAQPAWFNVSPPADLPQDSVAVDPANRDLVYVGADIGVWKSSDGGGTWAHLGAESGMPNVAVYDVEIHAATGRAFAFTHGRGAFVLACSNDAECNAGNANAGAATCDLATGRCQLAAASPTATPSVISTPTATATVTRTASATPTASATITATPTAMPTATRTTLPTATASLTATATATSSPTPPPTRTRTATQTSTPTGALPGNDSGCSIASARNADAGGVVWLWIVPFLWRARRRKRCVS